MVTSSMVVKNMTRSWTAYGPCVKSSVLNEFSTTMLNIVNSAVPAGRGLQSVAETSPPSVAL